VQQWSTSVEKSLGRETTFEVGYLGSRGIHLQRADLINNAPPGPGAIGPRRPYKFLAFVDNSALPAGVTVSPTMPAGCPRAQSAHRSAPSTCSPTPRKAGTTRATSTSAAATARGLSLLANYSFAKSLSNAPDFRSPMFESSIHKTTATFPLKRAGLQHQASFRRQSGLQHPRSRRFAFRARAFA